MRHCQLEHQELANAAQQDRAAAHSQIAKLTSDLETAEQRVVALQQSLTDASTAHAQALQVTTERVLIRMGCLKNGVCDSCEEICYHACSMPSKLTWILSHAMAFKSLKVVRTGARSPFAINSGNCINTDALLCRLVPFLLCYDAHTETLSHVCLGACQAAQCSTAGQDHSSEPDVPPGQGPAGGTAAGSCPEAGLGRQRHCPCRRTAGKFHSCM